MLNSYVTLGNICTIHFKRSLVIFISCGYMYAIYAEHEKMRHLMRIILCVYLFVQRALSKLHFVWKAIYVHVLSKIIIGAM